MSRSVAIAPQVTAAVISPQVIAPATIDAPELAVRPHATQRAKGRAAYSTPSIMDALRSEPLADDTIESFEVAVDQYSTNETVYPFSEPELLEAWKTFVEKIDAPQLKSALGAREPSITSDWRIEYDLDTELQFNRLALDIKPKLQSYLRQHFRNEAIEIQFKVSTSESNLSNIPYTDTERWALLVEKYPPLANLKSKFGLDFEHF
jgi:hypothetical protein